MSRSGGQRPRIPGRATAAPTAERMRRMLLDAGIRLDGQALDRLWRFHSLLHQRNADRDLTRITGFEPMVLKHYVDSMIVGDLFPLPATLLDIGTGAGFPGIPLAIRYPQIRFTLAEPRPRRVQFLNEVRTALALDNVQVFDHKVSSRSFRHKMAGVITRALEPMEKTLARTGGCTTVGSRYVFLKGPNVQDELAQIRQRFGGELHLVLDRAYTLPRTPHHRRLIVLERTAEAAHKDASDDGDEAEEGEEGE
jgi:16S rRNA (guanine527-N7)-methyltransferase